MDSNDKSRYEVDGKDAKSCPRCQSEEIILRACLGSDGRLMLRMICNACGYECTLKKRDTKYKRTSGPLKKWADEVKARDNYRCILCGSTYRIEAHHILPVSHDHLRQYIFKINNGVTLCRDCHEKVHWGDQYAF